MAEDGNNQLLDVGDDNNDIFVYTGGRAPRDVRRVRICGTLDTIPANAFADCRQLIKVKGHDKLRKIEERAFSDCPSLRRVKKMAGVREIEEWAFYHCDALCEVDFDKLEFITGFGAFEWCKSLRTINLPYIKCIGQFAFYNCEGLTDAAFGEDLERIERSAFWQSPTLRRIAIPLKDNLNLNDDAFDGCEKLVRVDVIGVGIHQTISSLHLESWRDEMLEKIDRINLILPEIPYNKTAAIQRWIRSVLDRMEHYKTEHKVLVKEAMALLELVLWKTKLLNEEGMQRKTEEEKKPKKAKIDKESTRKEHRVTCGANIVIKNVLPFLALKK